MFWVLFYDAVDDYVERRAEYRAQHLRAAVDSLERGELVMAGALAEPADGAVLIFQGPDDRAAVAFAQNDPYVINGLVTNWRVRQWTVVVGPGIEPPAL